MKKIIILVIFASITLFANSINELTKKMIHIHKNNAHTEQKLDKPYVIKGYAETKLNLVIENDKRYLFVKNLTDDKYVYILFEFKPGNDRSAFNKTRVKVVTKCTTLVGNAYYKDCL